MNKILLLIFFFPLSVFGQIQLRIDPLIQNNHEKSVTPTQKSSVNPGFWGLEMVMAANLRSVFPSIGMRINRYFQPASSFLGGVGLEIKTPIRIKVSNCNAITSLCDNNSFFFIPVSLSASYQFRQDAFGFGAKYEYEYGISLHKIYNKMNAHYGGVVISNYSFPGVISLEIGIKNYSYNQGNPQRYYVRLGFLFSRFGFS